MAAVPDAVTVSCLGSILDGSARQMGVATERLEQRHLVLQHRQSGLHQRLLGRKSASLGIEPVKLAGGTVFKP